MGAAPLDVGIGDYITRPLQAAELDSVLKKILLTSTEQEFFRLRQTVEGGDGQLPLLKPPSTGSRKTTVMGDCVRTLLKSLPPKRSQHR